MRRRLKILVFLVPIVLMIVFLLRYAKAPLTRDLTRDLTSTAVPDCRFDRPTRLLRTKECWGKSLKQRWRRFYNDTTCKDSKHLYNLKKLLEFWIKFAGKHSIRYALMWGTLLGLERVNYILPWDHDIDIIIDYKDILKLERIVNKQGSFYFDDGHPHVAVIPDVAMQHNVSMDNRARRTCQGKVYTIEHFSFFPI